MKKISIKKKFFSNACLPFLRKMQGKNFFLAFCLPAFFDNSQKVFSNMWLSLLFGTELYHYRNTKVFLDTCFWSLEYFG